MDIAHLGLAVDSATVEKGARSLDGLTNASVRAERAVDGFNASAGHTPARLNASTDAMRKNTAALHAQAAAQRQSAMMSRQLSFQLVDIGQALATAPTMGIYALQNLGFQIAQIGQLYAGNGGFNQAIKDSAAQVGRFAARMGPLAAAVGLVSIGIAGLRHEINKTSSVTVSYGDVALGVIQTIRDGLWSILKPGVDALAPWFKAAWDGVVDFTKFGINSVIGLFVGGFNAIKVVWNGLPSAIGDLVMTAANNTLAGIEALINGTVQRIQSLNDMLPKWAQSDTIRNLGSVSLPKLDNPYAGAGGDMMAGISGAFSDAKRDYAGAFGSAVKSRAISNALSRIEEDAKKGKDRLGELARSALGWLGQLADETNKKVQDAKEWISKAADYVSGRFDQFFDGIRNGKSAWESLRDVALGVLNDIAKAMLRSGIQNILGNIFGSNVAAPLQSGIPFPVAHSGWNVGNGPAPASRTLPSNIFYNAPRLHNGLAPDEFPAILQRGERVIPKGGGSGASANRVEIVTYFDQGEWKQEVRNMANSEAAKVTRAAAPGIAKQGAAAAKAGYAQAGGWVTL